MRRILLALGLLTLASPALAQNYAATAGSGLTFGSKFVTSVNYPQIVFCDPTTPAQCVAVNASGQLSLVANQSVNTAQINGVTPLMGNGVTGTGSQRVTIASDNTAFSVNAAATLAAETTKVIGTTRTLGNAGAILDFAGQNASSPANSWLIGAQFNTTPTTITTGNVSPLQMDSAGNLLVNIKAGAGSGGTALADGAVFTQGTTSLTPIGCFFTSGTYTAITTLHAGVLSCTSAGSLHTTVDNTLTALVNNADGVAAISAITATAGNSPVNSTGYVFNGTTYDRMRSATQTGSVAVGSSDPCLGANKTNLPINQNGTASVQLVALSGATVVYVCSLSLIAAGATTVALTTGTGSACVTGNAAVIGTTTASIANSMSLAANGGLTLGNGAGTVAKGAASSELCMVLGTNVFVSGNLTYVQQ